MSAAAAALLLPGAGWCQGAWPARPLSLVVPYAPGGVADAIARIISTRLSQSLGQPVLVENRAGGNGLIGSDFVANARPDGYTIVMMIETNTIAPALYPRLAHDPLRSFAPITLLARASQVIVAGPGLAARDLRELIVQTREKDSPVFYASSGMGTASYLGMEQLKKMSAMKLQHVSYKGGGQAITDLLAGQVPLAIIGIAPALPHVRSGRLKALAVTGRQRSSALPDVPTVQEQGIEGFESSNWFGLLAPAGTPQAIVDRLHAESTQAMRDPRLADTFEKLPVEVVTSASPRDFARFMADDVARWKTLVKNNHLTRD